MNKKGSGASYGGVRQNMVIKVIHLPIWGRIKPPVATTGGYQILLENIRSDNQ